MKKINFKYLRVSIILSLCTFLLLSCARFDISCEGLRDNVLRLHILANSDSEIDQNIKLKVRDAVLELCPEIFSDSDDITEAVENAAVDIPKLTETANRVLSDNGFEYKAVVSVEENYFSTRVYDTYTLPAGYYNSVTIRLGKAQGKNWWCIMYPSVCISSARLKNGVPNDSNEVAENQDKYIIKFWIVELYEKICNMF